MDKINLSSKKISTRQITIIGMLGAISVILGSTGFGFIPLPFAKATIMHIPVIIGSILEGPLVGGLVGLIFGLFSIYQNVVNPNILSFAFINPLVSVLPRVLIGIVSFYVYKYMFGKSSILKIGVSAAIGSLTNTVGVLGMIYILYAARFAAAKGISVKIALNSICSIAVLNGIPEALLAVIISIPIVLAVKKISRN